MRELAEIFKALSDETRLEILALLIFGGELCVCDVMGALGITQSKASRHLRYLFNAGLVENRRVGVWMHYCIAPDVDPARQAVLATARRVISEQKRTALENKLNQWLAQKGTDSEMCTG